SLAAVHPSPFETAWAILLLLLAPLVLVPLGLQNLVPRFERDMHRSWTIAARLQLPAALLLSAAFLVDRGLVAAALALPWLGVSGLLAGVGLMKLRRSRLGSLQDFSAVMACIYLSVGSAWAVLDRAGFRPLGFEPVIVLLTAIHFHYAGFVLPLLTGVAVRQ